MSSCQQNARSVGTPRCRGGILASMNVDQNAVLIIIDVQKAFDDPRMGKRNNPGAEKNIARLLDAWRASGRPIIHVRHDSVEPHSMLRPGQPGNEIKAEAKPKADEPVIGKHVNSAFIGTDLEQRLRKAGQDTVVCAGLTTDHCVSTTARMSGNLGFKTVWLQMRRRHSSVRALTERRCPRRKSIVARWRVCTASLRKSRQQKT